MRLRVDTELDKSHNNSIIYAKIKVVLKLHLEADYDQGGWGYNLLSSWGRTSWGWGYLL